MDDIVVWVNIMLNKVYALLGLSSVCDTQTRNQLCYVLAHLSSEFYLLTSLVYF